MHAHAAHMRVGAMPIRLRYIVHSLDCCITAIQEYVEIWMLHHAQTIFDCALLNIFALTHEIAQGKYIECMPSASTCQ
jgi:hypothetical protein